MPPPRDRVPLPHSERATPPGTRLGPVDPNERVEVTVRLRSRSRTGLPSVQEMSARLPRDRQYLKREQFRDMHGADPQDLAKIRAFAVQHGLDVVAESLAQRSVALSGTAAAMSKAFGVELARYQDAGRAFRGRTGPLYVPAELAPIVEGVFGLDDRPQARPHFRRSRARGGAVATAVGPRAAGAAFTPPQLAALYDFPSGTGRGQCIGIIELGGGYRPGDLSTYFAQLNIQAPQVVAVSVDGGRNAPTTPDSDDVEVLLDIEVAGAIASGARIVVYFAPNTDRGFLDAITTAVHDSTNNPSVISISWGAPEASWTTQAMLSFDQAFQEAAALGVTVCCAAGDNGSSDGVQDGQPHVDFQASSSFVLGCGGTNLSSTGTTITSEVVWNDPGDGATGGGVSRQFALPPWQANAGVPPSPVPGFRGRGVPDVAGDASPATGYIILVDGQLTTVGGTSAVAPLWAGLIALLNELKGKPVGYLNPVLYGPTSKGVFHDITQGNNGAYAAGPGWDACTGLGSPDGAKLLNAL
ncbi:MAG: peptidase S53 [Bacillati bacterium ANGP1]|uniref:Peptidase S53 n=1 Tax=Candidatus Segetimicrobium genomatis TaxID=2569760 RepID=A0A537M891_9BACT|nr:MAG: peptidase S53 [Terrabacteria group bacterium ANGP1]